ncbi:hypothetical protein AC52_0365 [Escherichia coli 5-366-08_S3_C3]|nr:hypothetical protein ECP030481611_2229 [Escherichia coli P0304816.11]ENF25611.1 hypothetical protein ECP030481610_1174 [Escherichia coli P0304816.10]ENF33170.1 hypothetical protein ECP030481614_3140 [Escherichia coli P0304816.14]ENF39213.1 hypothetical protein ECP030481613_3112 [Escherichia coli P0304816.13]ENF42464.1 hypothetical protein ECP030481615_4707 [Escherichia coli P0304816.15]ENF44614.1 hypothetical protein ECP03048166_4828 [Escherichia coli P0304816.6]ENF61144.1 hypothetical pro
MMIKLYAFGSFFLPHISSHTISDLKCQAIKTITIWFILHINYIKSYMLS